MYIYLFVFFFFVNIKRTCHWDDQLYFVIFISHDCYFSAFCSSRYNLDFNKGNKY